MKTSNKSATRSPLKQEPLRNPGEGLARSYNAFLDEKVMPWFVLVAMLCVWTAIEWIQWWAKAPPNPLMVSLLAVGGTVVSVIRIRIHLRRLDGIALGVKGEKTVGQALEHFRSEGYRVFHDVEDERGNIDHVLIGPAGVFVIETKTVSKGGGSTGKIDYDGQEIVVDGHVPDRDPIAQVRACAASIRSILEPATGLKPKIRPVVLYPGWWVDPQPKGVEVWVLNLNAFPAFVRYEEASLAESEVRQLASALETHIRVREANRR